MKAKSCRSGYRLLVPILLVLLPGCVAGSLERRYGPEPILQAAKVEDSSLQKDLILKALARDAGLVSIGPADWYEVAEAGFNYVDDQCRAYFDELFFIERRRDRIKTGLISAGQTTAALLSITGAPTMSLAVAAQAFGLGGITTDLVAGTYLFNLPPSTTQGFVQRLQLAFRDASAQASRSINSPARAYYIIQRYLDLCLPPRIETEIARHIATARALPVARGNGAFFSLETISPRTALESDPLPRRPFGRTSPSRGDPAPARQDHHPRQPPGPQDTRRGPVSGPLDGPVARSSPSPPRDPTPPLAETDPSPARNTPGGTSASSRPVGPRIGVPSSPLGEPIPRTAPPN